MSIRFKKYVDIVSGVGGNAPVATRDLILRIFSVNPLIPTGSFADFTTADQVGEYFGFNSEEYKRAAFYFGWVSKSITAAKKLSFARWADADTAPLIYGNTAAKLLATFTAIDAGGFTLSLGGVDLAMTAIDLSGAASLAAVATAIQTKIRTGVGTQFTNATVTYDAVRGSFNFVGGDVGEAAISVTDGAQGVAAALGWVSGTGLILSDGADQQTVAEVLAQSAGGSNNFGSFLFQATLTLDEVTEAAEWNATQNILFMYLQRVQPTDAAAWSAALVDISGTALTLASPVGVTEYPEMVPGIILAATAYDRRNAVQNYMFQQFALTPSVTTDADSDSYDALRVNYYGQTQTAGQQISFYQRGKMMGGNTSPSDQNVYANEQWLKDAAGARIMSLLLALPRLSANATGRSQVLGVLQSIVDDALFNGTISVGKPLTPVQKLYIGQITGDENAWRQVQNIGYWLDVVIAPYTADDDTTEYKATYTLVYSKDDAIRKVEGSHVLI